MKKGLADKVADCVHKRAARVRSVMLDLGLPHWTRWPIERMVLDPLELFLMRHGLREMKRRADQADLMARQIWDLVENPPPPSEALKALMKLPVLDGTPRGPKRVCTCTGMCRGAERLGENWVCALKLTNEG